MDDKARRTLLKRLHFLRNRAPDEFRAMNEALNQYAGGLLSGVTKVPAEDLVRYQGVLQGMESLLTILTDSETKPTD